MKKYINILIGFLAALVFSALYFVGFLDSFEDRLYDFFLRFRAERDYIDSVVYLDIDDGAIDVYGVYPWPRSILADGLLRLKEYGARASIFDIEYIDEGPKGIDSVYLDQHLENDFFRSFSRIGNTVVRFYSDITEGRVRQDDYYALLGLIDEEHANLYHRALNIARDNDVYLAQAIILNGNTWSTLNLRDEMLVGEQAERRTEIAEQKFAYPVRAAYDAHKGAGFIDVLTALPVFANISKGAGYTNVEIDDDGVRRRVFLAQNIQDHWYLQLSFAPLIEYLGSPEIFLEKNKLTVKQAAFPDGTVKDFVIPLDQKGRMMLDWPKEDYNESYEHLSFANFKLLDDIETELDFYSYALYDVLSEFDPAEDSFLITVSDYLSDAIEVLYAAQNAKNHAIENNSDNSFYTFLDYRNLAYSLLDEIIMMNLDEDIYELALQLAGRPEYIMYIEDDLEYILSLYDIIRLNLERHRLETAKNEKLIKDKFVIMGWVGTGTTDYGANPFHPKYINVGTHGVVLDTILSESFILPLNQWWRIWFLLIFIPLFIIFTAGLAPVLRAVSGFAVTLFIFVAAVFLFRITGIYWGPLGAVLAMIICVITREIISYASSEKEKQFIRTAFSTYLSGDVVKELINDPSRLQLGGTKRNMTAIFTDVKAFSTISEKLDPEELVSLLNRYLSAMSDIILDEKGTIDKYEGDAIIAFFGAPLDLPDHALRACISAIKIKKIETELNKEIMEHKLSPMPLLTRVGINTGFMVVGNMGTANKMNYTIMGDAVNLAARLEGVNKQYGTWILASEDTIKETGNALLYRKLDRVRVVGKSEPVRLHELVDTMELAAAEDKKLIKIFHEALNCFEKREWKQAAAGFKETLSLRSDDAPAKIYLERCQQFMSHPPKPDWDGVYNLTSK